MMATALGIRRGKPVLCVHRLALANDRPLVIGRHHFPLPRFASLARSLATQSSITKALADSGTPDYERAWTRVTARLPSPEEALLLQQSRSRPVLVAEALNRDPRGHAVDFTFATYAAGRVQILVEE